MPWRIYTREASGNEDVASEPSKDAAIARTQDLLMRSIAIIRIESDEGEIIEGKQLQELLAASWSSGSRSRH